MEGARGTVLGPSWTSFGESLPHDSPSIFPPCAQGAPAPPSSPPSRPSTGLRLGWAPEFVEVPFAAGSVAATEQGQSGEETASCLRAKRLCLPGLAAVCRVIPVRHRINRGCSFHLIPKTPSQEKPRSLPTVSSAGPHAALRQALLVGALAAVQNVLPCFSNIRGYDERVANGCVLMTRWPRAEDRCSAREEVSDSHEEGRGARPGGPCVISRLW